MIELKSPQEIEKMRRAGRIVAEILEILKEKVVPGVTTSELDKIAEELMTQRGAKPAFKGYRGYRHSLCTSVNEEVVHGIPGKRALKEGDIIGLDCGVIVDGFYGDAARTCPVGKVDADRNDLIEVTRESLNKGLAQVVMGNRIHDISWAVQSYAEKEGYSVVRDFVGHGIGRQLHEDPQVPNFGEPHTGPRLGVGIVLAIEPMVNQGGPEVKILEDGWTAVTVDSRFSAHFEDTIALTEKGPEILTRV
ncbi:MAG: type I methionyl aminopeptidase [Deltaproteobacteria bacterium]|nr:type I methionyl aminopeptidase [Deltaproteobacteria bacterium]